ncbi:Hypothetical protein BROD_2345 [Brucella sp. NF 2653]|nr:Hypothetical protein BROD_2345 [Brucella sp. NF 2653]
METLESRQVFVLTKAEYYRRMTGNNLVN